MVVMVNGQMCRLCVCVRSRGKQLSSRRERKKATAKEGEEEGSTDRLQCRHLLLRMLLASLRMPLSGGLFKR